MEQENVFSDDGVATYITSTLEHLYITEELNGNFSECLKAIHAIVNDNQQSNKTNPVLARILELHCKKDYKALQNYIDDLMENSKTIKSSVKNPSSQNTSPEFNCKEVHLIVSSWIENNICRETCNQPTALTLFEAHLFEEENICKPDMVPPLHQTILQLYKSGEYPCLVKFIQNTVATLYSSKTEEYEDKIRQTLRLLRNLISSKYFEDIAEEAEIYIALVGYLTKQEERWRAKNAQNILSLWQLPPTHRSILLHFEKADEQKTVQYIREILQESFQIDSIAYIQSKVELTLKEKDGKFELGEKLVVSLGSTLTVGLSTLHVLVPATSAFKSLIDEINLMLLNPSLSCTGVLVGLSGAIVTGICLFNAYKAYKGTISKRQAGKRIIDSVVPFAISTGVGFLLAASLASVAPPIWVTLVTFAGIGFLVHWVATVGVGKFTEWILYDLPKKKALKRAYQTLGCEVSVTDEQLKKIYKKKLREFHPDMHARKEATEEERELARKMYFQVQDAFQVVLEHRIEQDIQDNEEGLLSRIRKFFSWSKRNDKQDCKSIPLQFDNKEST